MEMSDWLCERRIADEHFNAAYENTEARARAALKTGIALAHQRFGERPESLERRLFYSNSGFVIAEAQKPADWAVIAMNSGYASGTAPVLAASILPLLAGVKHIFGFAHASPHYELLISLEMCGCREAFALDSRETRRALEDLGASLPEGRIICVNPWQAVETAASELGLRCFTAASGAALVADADAFDRDVLRFCLGNSIYYDPDACANWYCVLARPGRTGCPDSRLRLGPGCEGFWLLDGLAPDFFTNVRSSFATCRDSG